MVIILNSSSGYPSRYGTPIRMMSIARDSSMLALSAPSVSASGASGTGGVGTTLALQKPLMAPL
jgi:hypothetical protein